MAEEYDWFKEQDRLFRIQEKEKRAREKLDLMMVEKIVVSGVDVLTLHQLENLRYLITQKIKKMKIYKRIKKHEGKK